MTETGFKILNEFQSAFVALKMLKSIIED